MPIAAVPEYLGRDFKETSPGMRFGMYLALWGTNLRTGTPLWNTHDLDYQVRGEGHQEREVKIETKVGALSAAKKLNANDKSTMTALLMRQRQLFVSTPLPITQYAVDAIAMAPFTTGLGNEHPLENGFAFLNPYGLPYLPGSGVKGVLRQAARELASGEWGDTGGWQEDKQFLLEVGKESIALSMIDALFGLESEDGERQHLRGALTFWDVIPQINGDSLTVEIMTPHQGHYYQQKLDAKTGNSTSPHDSGQPVPISFLTVPPGSGFTFHIQCNLEHLAQNAPELAESGCWKILLEAAFKHAFAWLGFGAKTSVGYGSMKDQAALKQELEAEYKQKLEAVGIKAGSAQWEKAKLIGTDPGAGNITIEGPDGKKVTGKFYSTLSDAAKKRFKNKKAVVLTVEIEELGNLIQIKSIAEAGE